jgi:hypothetical protein
MGDEEGFLGDGGFYVSGVFADDTFLAGASGTEDG